MISFKQPTILVIEDDDSVRQTLIDILELNGFHGEQASNGADGLALARREQPELIITDIEMPGMTGFELLKQFRSDEMLRSTPVIVVSAKVDRADTRRGMELGADDFITKPFTEEEVIRSIHTRLEKKELLDELDAFAHTVAHDLKNPLSTLYGRLDLIGMDIGEEDDETLRRHVAEAALAARRLTGIIDELLLLAGVRRQHIDPTMLNMSEIVDEALAQLEALVKRSGARIEKPETWPVAIGYRPWIVHVWSNYVSNAAKYAGVAPLITLGCDSYPGGRKVRFWVQDSGPGLGSAAQSALFVPFTRISSVRASGHGLGLSIVRRIIEKLGGQVGVESQPGQGARFWFELPCITGGHTSSPFPK